MFLAYAVKGGSFVADVKLCNSLFDSSSILSLRKGDIKQFSIYSRVYRMNSHKIQFSFCQKVIFVFSFSL